MCSRKEKQAHCCLSDYTDICKGSWFQLNNCIICFILFFLTRYLLIALWRHHYGNSAFFSTGRNDNKNNQWCCKWLDFHSLHMIITVMSSCMWHLLKARALRYLANSTGTKTVHRLDVCLQKQIVEEVYIKTLTLPAYLLGQVISKSRGPDHNSSPLVLNLVWNHQRISGCKLAHTG